MRACKVLTVVKQTLINILLITIPILVFFTLLCEVVFRTIIPATDGLPQHYFDKEWLLLKFELNQTGIIRIGLPNEIKARYRTNSDGWNSPIDYSEERNEERRIAVMGDSYVAAFQFDPEYAFPQVLENELVAQGHSVEVYRFGMPGAPMSQYVQMMKYVCDKFHPDLCIVTIIHNDFDPSLVGWGSSFWLGFCRAADQLFGGQFSVSNDLKCEMRSAKFEKSVTSTHNFSPICGRSAHATG